MIRYLLDTDHFTLEQHGHGPLRAKLASVAPDAVALSAVTAQEVIRGRLAVLNRPPVAGLLVVAYAKFTEAVRFFGSGPVLEFDSACEAEFFRLRNLKLRIGTQDLKIASVALVHGLAVVTRNRKDFGQVPNLPIEDWSH